jgi:hypothetical protein
VGDRVSVTFMGKKRVEAVIDGQKQMVTIDDVVTRPGEVEQVATECAEIRHDDDNTTRWYPWEQLVKKVGA